MLTTVKWDKPLEYKGHTLKLVEWVAALRNRGGWSFKAINAFLRANGGGDGLTYDKVRKVLNGRETKPPQEILDTTLPDSLKIDSDYWRVAGGNKNMREVNQERIDAEVEREANPPANADSNGTHTYELEVQGDDILSAEDVMRNMGLDPKDWEIVSFEARLKDVIQRNEFKNLEATAGRWEGSVSASPTVTQLYAYHLKVKPAQPEFEIKAVRINITNTDVLRRDHEDGLRTMLLVSDSQIGFDGDKPHHDRRVLSIALDVATSLDPDHIVFTGDWLDFEQFGKWDSESDVKNAQRTIYECGYWFGQFRNKCPRSEIDLIEGNHDMRLRVSLRRNIPAAANLSAVHNPGNPVLGLKHLLGLDELSINLHNGWPGNDMWFGDHLRVMHGEKYSSSPGGTVAAVLKDADENTIVGHSHHSEVARKNRQTRNGPRTVTAVSLPCACHVDGRVPGRTANPDWHQGFGIVYFDMNSPLFHYRSIDVVNGTAIHAHGRVIKGEARAHESAIIRTFGKEW